MDSSGSRFFGTYYDGQVADPRKVSFVIDRLAPDGIDPRDEMRYRARTSYFVEILDLEMGHEIARWDLADMYAKPSRKGELRLAAQGMPPGARLVISDPNMARAVKSRLPLLALHQRKHRSRQTSIIGLVTLAMGSLVAAYIYGVPLLADRIVTLVPAETEIKFGETIVAQLDSAFAEQGGLRLCDSDPQSVANIAISRFAKAALEGVDTPFDANIQVVANSVPNAFALPGGKSYYFSGLLKETQTADEFAGVMAHELGHVIHRHGMEQLISNAGTGLLVGFVLGDITGLSVAGGIGSALINNSFSRDAEREADEFSFQVAARLNFDPVGLANLLDRISEDDDFSAALALLSTHPLNLERREAMQAMGSENSSYTPAFSSTEWLAISAMCDPEGTPAPQKVKRK
ncbi:MAG TPA: M48 family metallopeptidase [Devosia sp.]|nr:M48 family metallopeptidase [Devosia sp.]